MKKRIIAVLLACVMVAGIFPAAQAAQNQPLDVVVVIDRSSEMAGEVLACTKVGHAHKDGLFDSCYATRFKTAKWRAEAITNAVLDTHADSRAAIVTFSQDASVRLSFTKSKSTIGASLDLMTRSLLSANIEAGLIKATEYLQENGRANAKKAIVLLSSGRPTYYYDVCNEVVLGTGTSVTELAKERTLEQAHLTRDSGFPIYSVGVGVGTNEENLMIAIQNGGYHIQTTSDLAGKIVSAIQWGDGPFDVSNPGIKWSVGFSKKSIVPSDLKFYSYKPSDLPANVPYDREVIRDDLSFSSADLPSGLAGVAAVYEQTLAYPGKYPAYFKTSVSSFLNRVLPVEAPFDPALIEANSGTFQQDFAAYAPGLYAAAAALDAGIASVRAARIGAYVSAGMDQAGAAAQADAYLAGIYSGTASPDETLNSAYANLLSGLAGTNPLSDYTVARTASKYYIAGYGSDISAMGYIDENHTRAVYLDDNTGRGGVILINVETVGMSRNDINRIRDRLAPFMLMNNIRDVHIMSAHNHAAIDSFGMWGPMLGDGKDEGYMSYLFSQIADAAVEAYTNRRDGRLFAGTADAAEQTDYPEPLVEDTRYPYVTRNSELVSRFRFVPSDGSKELYIVHFAAHLEALQGKNNYSSADFLDPFADYLAENSDAEFMYFSGAIGGLIRTQKNLTISSDFTPKHENHRYWEVTRVAGRRLGELVCGIAPADEIELEPKLNIATTAFEVKIDNYLLALMAHLDFISTGIYIKDVPTGLVNTALGIASLKTLISSAADAGSTFFSLTGAGMDLGEAFLQSASGFGQVYLNIIRDNLATMASTEMSYLEMYEKDGDRIKGIALVPGEVFQELVYGGLLDTSNNDWALDAHNPSEANPATFVEIAAGAGRDYGPDNRDLIVFGLANDMMGYIIPPNDFLLDPTLPFINENDQGSGRRHYEETNSTGINAARLVAAGFERLMDRASD